MNKELYELLKSLDDEVLVTQAAIKELIIFVHKIDSFILLAKYSYCLGVHDERHKTKKSIN